MCVEILFVHADCHCIARVGTYTCASQVYKKQPYSTHCPNFKSTHQFLRAAGRTCQEHVGCVFEEIGLDSSDEDELVGNGDAGIEGVEGKNVDKGKGVEVESDGDENKDVDPMELDMEGDTEYEESSSSSGEEVEGGSVLDGVEVSEGGGIDEETFRSDSEEEGYRADIEESFGREGTAAESDTRGRMPTSSSSNEISPAVDVENDEEEWVNTSSPITSSSPPANNRTSTSPPTFTDSPTKRSVSSELTAAMANLSLNTRTPSNSRIPSIPRPSSARGTSRPSSKQPSTSTNVEIESGGLPYLRRTLNTGIPTSSSTSSSRNTPVSVAVSGNPSTSSNRTLPTPKRQISTRSLPIPSSASESSTTGTPETLLEAARRRLSGGKSLRNISVTGSDTTASLGNGTPATTPGSSNIAAAISTAHAHLSAIENPSVSRRSLAHTATAAGGINDENTPLGNGGRGLRHVGSLSGAVGDKELPSLPRGELGVRLAVERELPALPKMDGEREGKGKGKGKVEMERLKRE